MGWYQRRVHGDLCQFRLKDIHSITMTAPKLILAGALVAIFLLSLDTVESQCLNCEAPYGPYCCKGSFNSVCCEYPISRMDKSLPQLSPLERQLKVKSCKRKSKKNSDNIMVLLPLMAREPIELEYFSKTMQRNCNQHPSTTE